MNQPHFIFTESQVHGANMGPIMDQQDPGWPHVGPMSFAIWVIGRTVDIDQHNTGKYQYGCLMYMCYFENTEKIPFSWKHI